jgi:hypothetical protein
MSEQPGPVPAVPLMAPEKARDIARGLKWLAERYGDAGMPEHAHGLLTASSWWLSYSQTLQQTGEKP